jgi:transcription antitermination factor NusG
MGQIAANANQECNAAPWYALCVLSGHEFEVERLLGQRGVATYVPTWRGKVRQAHQRRAREVCRAVWPGYVFARVGLGQWPAVRAPLAVVGVIGVDGVPLVIPAREVDRVRADEAAGAFQPRQEAARAQTTVRMGDTVTVYGGPLQGLAGTVRAVTAKRALIDFGARAVSLPLDALDVARAAA